MIVYKNVYNCLHFRLQAAAEELEVPRPPLVRQIGSIVEVGNFASVVIKPSQKSMVSDWVIVLSWWVRSVLIGN